MATSLKYPKPHKAEVPLLMTRFIFQGCRVRDHVVNTPQLNSGSEPDLLKSPNKVYDDLLAHRDAVCIPYQRLSDARYVAISLAPNSFTPTHTHTHTYTPLG